VSAEKTFRTADGRRSMGRAKEKAMTDVVLVHGAWHGAWCWRDVVEALERLGVTSSAVELPLTGLRADADAAREVIEKAGTGTVVVGHSYGGAVITEAASGLDGVSRLVYLAAFMLDNDEDEIAVMSAHDSAVLTSLVERDGGIAVDPAKAHGLFYADSDDATVAEILPLLRPMHADAARAQRPPAWKAIPSTYVVCTADGALPPAAQREMAARADTVIEWPTDHSPFLTRPGEIATLVASYVTEQDGAGS
jgi:pimeloyl-ACP methyl ester carboxylesterase